MTLAQFSQLAQSYWPGKTRTFSTPQQVAKFVLLGSMCVRQERTIEASQWVAELVSGATAQAVSFREAKPDLDAAHIYLLELEVEYDSSRITTLWSEIETLVKAMLPVTER